MPYIEIYQDGATDAEIHTALTDFMKTNDSFEASNWLIQKLPNGKFESTCCVKCGKITHDTLEDWQEGSCVYPDQKQWVGN